MPVSAAGGAGALHQDLARRKEHQESQLFPLAFLVQRLLFRACWFAKVISGAFPIVLNTQFPSQACLWLKSRSRRRQTHPGHSARLFLFLQLPASALSAYLLIFQAPFAILHFVQSVM